jgi:hypothetical protein
MADVTDADMTMGWILYAIAEALMVEREREN